MNRTPSRAGFTLIEVLVTMMITLFVLFLLARSMDLVTRTVTGGHRLLELERTLETAHRVLRDDVEAMVKNNHWLLRVDGGTEGPALAFLRYRLEAPGDVATEWVQYWREPHPEEPRLFQWVRYSGPADNRLDLSVVWWEEVERSDLNREVVLDDAIAVNTLIQMDTVGPVESSDLIEPTRIEAVDLRLAATTYPYPVVGDLPANPYERIQLENGTWIEFRVRPEGQP